MKRITSVILALVTAVCLLVTCSISVAAAPSRGTTAKFYLLKEGLPVPSGVGSQPKANYVHVGTGSINKMQSYYNEDGVDDRIINAPKVELKDGQSIVWYVVKYEGDGWHVDGVVTPFYTFVYSANADDATGETTDPAHYYKNDTVVIKENGFTRDGYEFVGWNTMADGSGISYSASQSFAANTLAFDKNINVTTLYAQWKAKPTDDKPNIDSENSIQMGIVTPKKMSVRFEDGKIYKTGDTLVLETGKDYKFQMCSNDWDTDTYTDDGHGIAGTVVYTVRVSTKFNERSYDAATHTFVLPKGDPVLRTDVNKCFMAYKFHFKTDYNKQTGIKQVVNTPLESLSVNLPLGSTITADAYKAMTYNTSANVFVENDEDMTLSYTTYNWGF